jgi:hypothetical protein
VPASETEILVTDPLMFRDAPLHVDWREKTGLSAEQMPRAAGLYAQIYWPDRAVRIGQSANIYSRLREATTWARDMQSGTARASQLRRTSELCERVKKSGNEGFKYFTISSHPMFVDESLRRECEAFLFGWFAATAAGKKWRNWNGERVRSELRAVFDDAFRMHSPQ